ncbi:MAG: hypothetical protein WA948_11445, partial [Pontixanthobacter sp.]
MMIKPFPCILAAALGAAPAIAQSEMASRGEVLLRTIDANSAQTSLAISQSKATLGRIGASLIALERSVPSVDDGETVVDLAVMSQEERAPFGLTDKPGCGYLDNLPQEARTGLLRSFDPYDL